MRERPSAFELYGAARQQSFELMISGVQILQKELAWIRERAGD
jgi:hypothetical protein